MIEGAPLIATAYDMAAGSGCHMRVKSIQLFSTSCNPSMEASLLCGVAGINVAGTLVGGFGELGRAVVCDSGACTNWIGAGSPVGSNAMTSSTTTTPATAK